MKRTLFILSMLIGICLSTSAQRGLQINEVFEGKVIAKQYMQESLIKGDNVAPYKLRLLHTVKFLANNSQRAKADALFNIDMRERISDDDSNMEMETRDGFLYYAIVQLTDNDKGSHRYICYQCRPKSTKFDITMVYMEGEASLADLRKTFKRK
ncbi:MAG: hypothetical protein J6W21_05445 [Bacteroidaceae bacterium]|nr:hypothetical protein [Bacteroidaceae bacterium]